MRRRLLPKDPFGLVGLLKALLTILSKKREELGLTFDIEFLLRASIRAATYTTDAYFAALAGAGQSAEAANYLPEAKRLRDRSVKQLRQRITRAIHIAQHPEQGLWRDCLLRGGEDVVNARWAVIDRPYRVGENGGRPSSADEFPARSIGSGQGKTPDLTRLQPLTMRLFVF